MLICISNITGKPEDPIHSLDLFDGDIRLSLVQEEILRASSARETGSVHEIHERAVTKQLTAMWPNGVVPYDISSKLRKLSSYLW